MHAERFETERLSRAETQRQVAQALGQLGVEPGCDLLFHSSFRPLSAAGFGPASFLEAVLGYLNTGTLALPAMSWREVSLANPQFDELTTKSNTGILSEIFRSDFADRRSLHPTHSVAAVGPHADLLLGEHHVSVTPCGALSPWGKLAGVGASVLLIGVDMDSCTLVHHLEETFAPDRYLRDEIENYDCRDRHGQVFPVRTRRHRKLHRNFWKFRAMIAAQGLLRETWLGNTLIYGFAARDLIACGSGAFGTDLDASLARAGEPSKLM